MRRSDISPSARATLIAIDPLYEYREKILCRDYDEGLALIYQWAKTDVINKKQFIELVNHHKGIWSL